MSHAADRCVYFVDDDIVQSQLSIEMDTLLSNKRAAGHSAVSEAVQLYVGGETERAFSTLRPAVATSNPDALLIAGQIAFEAGRMEDAARYYKRLSEVKPDHPYASLNTGICLARLRKWRMAIEALQRAVVLDSDRSQAWFVLGVCLLNEHRAAEARASFAHSLRLKEDYVPAWFGQAAALQLEGKPEEALAIYDRLLSAHTPSAGAIAVKERQRELLENALFAAWHRGDRAKLKHYAADLAHLEPGVTASQHGMWAHLVLAIEAKDFDAAVGYASQLAESNSAVDWFNYGICLRLAGRHAEAAEAFEHVVGLRPEDAAAWRELGASKWSSGDLDRAVAAYEEALSRDPTNHHARRALLVLAVERCNLEQVLDLRDAMTDLDGEFAYRIGILYHRRGDFDQASRLYLECLSQHPQHAECQWDLAHAFFALNRIPEAKMHWRRALDLKPELAITALAGVSNHDVA